MATFDVLLPVKNCVSYLGEAIESICAQTFRDWRLLILDHGSSDGSLELAYAYARSDIRIEVHFLPQAVGLAGLLNKGLDLCDCRYVLRQDADDISLPNRMAVLAQIYAADPELSVLGSLGEVIDAQGRRIGSIDMPTGEHGMAAAALFRTPICHPAASMRLETLQLLGARYGEDFMHVLPEQQNLIVPSLAEDYFMFGQLALMTRCRNIPQKLIRYRWHGSNVGATRYLEQMQIALSVSRHLADSLAAIYTYPLVDPAPLCTHGEALFDIKGRSNFDSEYAQLSALLARHVSGGADLKRELAFRRVVAERAALPMAARFAYFAARYGTGLTERRAIKSWLLRGVRRRPVLALPASASVQTI